MTGFGFDPARPRGTGPLVPGAIRPIAPPAGVPAAAVPPPPIRPPRAPGTTRLDPDVLEAHAPAFGAPAEAPPIVAPQAARAIDAPEWVGVKRQLSKLDGVSPRQRQRLETYVARYAKGGGDPKVARVVLQQIAAPFDQIGQSKAWTCAVTGPQQELARRGPARYFRIMTELANDGAAKLDPGKQLDTGNDNYERIMKKDMPMNERLNLLFQTAGMEYANLRARYNPDSDMSVGPKDQYRGVGETGAALFGQALLEGKADLIGHKRLKQRVASLRRDHLAAGTEMPGDGALRVRALRQLVEEGQARGRESFFVKLKVPGGRHHLILEKLDATGATLVDHRGAHRMSDAQLAEYLSLTPGRGGYDPAVAVTGTSTSTRRPRPTSYSSTTTSSYSGG